MTTFDNRPQYDPELEVALNELGLPVAVTPEMIARSRDQRVRSPCRSSGRAARPVLDQAFTTCMVAE